MDYISISNTVLSEYINLINNIKELPSHTVDQILQSYTPLNENEYVELLQNYTVHMSNEELDVVHKTLVIVSDIDQAINEYISTMDIETLKAIIKNISIHYKIG